MTRHDDRSQAGRDLANGLLADLGGAPLPEEGVRETHGHNAASFAVEAHRPPAAHHMGTQPNPVVVSQTDPVWPPKTAATLVSAGNELVSSTELDRSMPPSSRDAVTVQRAPVSVRGGERTVTELPSPSPPMVVRPMVGRTTAPSVRVKSSVSKAIIGGFAVGGVLVAAMGLWFVLSKDPAPVAAPASTVVVSVMRPSSAVVTAEAPASTPASTPVVVTPPVVTASAVAAPAVVTRPRSPGVQAAPPAPAPPKPTSKPNPTSGPIEEPDRTF